MKRTNTAKWDEKRGHWRIAVQKDGIRKNFYSSTKGRNGQREANAKADAWLDDGIESQLVKVSAAWDMYIDSLKASTSKDHYRKYEGYGRNYILPAIGKKRMTSLSEQDLQDIINTSYKRHGLSFKTLSGLRGCLHQFIKYSRKKRLCALVIDALTIPKAAPKPEKTILQPDQLKKLMTLDRTDLGGKEGQEPFIYAYRFQVLTGLRPGELIGLKREDVKDGILTVRRSITRDGESTAGKNDNARRTFALTPQAEQVLQDQYKMIAEKGIVSPYIFCADNGTPIRQTTYYKHWIRYRDYNHISDTVTPYELRHTFISLSQTLPTEYVKRMVGHSASMDTYGVYGHAVDGDLIAAADMLSGIFKGIL
jgi:integrase